jgi:hypothetical protein
VRQERRLQEADLLQELPPLALETAVDPASAPPSWLRWWRRGAAPPEALAPDGAGTSAPIGANEVRPPGVPVPLPSVVEPPAPKRAGALPAGDPVPEATGRWPLGEDWAADEGFVAGVDCELSGVESPSAVGLVPEPPVFTPSEDVVPASVPVDVGDCGVLTVLPPPVASDCRPCPGSLVWLGVVELCGPWPAPAPPCG